MKKTLSTAAIIAVIVPILSFAQATTTTGTTTSPTATSTQIICMQNALEKRENALIGSLDAYNTSSKTALTNRLSGLKTAWAATDRKTRIEKRLATYKAFRNEMQAANNTLRNSKNSAWKTFESDARACGIKGTGEAPAVISSSNTTL